MIPTTIVDPKLPAIQDALWGSAENLPACLGIHKQLPWYWGIHVPKSEDNGEFQNINAGYPYFRENFTEWDFAGHVNIPIIDYEYEPKHGLIRPLQSFYLREENNKKVGYDGLFSLQQNTISINKQGECLLSTDWLNKKNVKDGFDYNQNIEKPFIKSIVHTHEDQTVQPLPYVGIQPIPANYPNGTDSYTNVEATWLIETEIVINCLFETNFTNSDKLYMWKSLSYGTAFPSGIDVIKYNNRLGRYPLTIQDPVEEELPSRATIFTLMKGLQTRADQLERGIQNALLNFLNKSLLLNSLTLSSSNSNSIKPCCPFCSIGSINVS